MIRTRTLLVTSLALVGVLALASCGYDPATHSTKGVVLVSETDGIAKLPIDETLVLKRSVSCGKTRCTYYWRFTTNGDGKLTVVNERAFGRDTRDFVVSRDNKTEIDTGWLSKPLFASLDTDGAVLVDWPEGFWSEWSFRSYDPPQ